MCVSEMQNVGTLTERQRHMEKHLFLYICCNLSIFLSSIFNIDQRSISGRHAFLKLESNKLWPMESEDDGTARGLEVKKHS